MKFCVVLCVCVGGGGGGGGGSMGGGGGGEYNSIDYKYGKMHFTNR